jgi:DNA-binding response OmpR family regulator
MAKRRVLIVEDDVTISLDLAAIVSDNLDAEIVISRSVARAKKLVEREVDLALLDVDVTNGKTFEVALLLKLRQIPFVFLSASRPEELPIDLRDAPFISKPYDERRLLERIRKLMPDED